jgi:hypothetical protein
MMSKHLRGVRSSIIGKTVMATVGINVKSYPISAVCSDHNTTDWCKPRTQVPLD